MEDLGINEALGRGDSRALALEAAIAATFQGARAAIRRVLGEHSHALAIEAFVEALADGAPADAAPAPRHRQDSALRALIRAVEAAASALATPLALLWEDGEPMAWEDGTAIAW